MFFPERIKSIKSSDRVLEIGPGGTPHPRSNVFLEKVFDPSEAEGQRGYAPSLQDKREIIFYEGGRFPFKDHEFDYVICTHVLEHVDNVDEFVSEITRVANKGYVEFPTVYYDFIYNFPEHITLLLYKNNTVFWIPKEESGLNGFKPINEFFYESLKAGYSDLINQLKDYFFQGFEWVVSINTQKVSDIKSITMCPSDINFVKMKSSNPIMKSVAAKLKNFIRT